MRYIGLTENTFKERWNQHKNSFKYEGKKQIPHRAIKICLRIKEKGHHTHYIMGGD